MIGNLKNISALFIAVLLAGCLSELKAGPFSELHVSGPCEVNIIFNTDSAGVVTLPKGRQSDRGLVVRRTADAMFLSLSPDSLRAGRLPVNVYCGPSITTIDASGRALIRSGRVNADGHLSVVSSGAASIDLGRVSADNINISLTGSGSIKIADGLRAPNVNMSLIGSGRLTADRIDARRLSVTQRGSGKIRLSGSSRNSAIVVLGSGMVDARALSGSDMKLKLFGAGQIYYRSDIKVSTSGKTENIHAVKN